MNLRKEAKGRPCKIRIPHVCNGNPETTVLCHPNKQSVFGSGTGSKPDDMFGAWGCSACHVAVDSRMNIPDGLGFYFDANEILIMFYEGVFRTQNQLLKEGKL